MYELLNVRVEFRNNEMDGRNGALIPLVFNSKLPLVRLKFPKRKLPKWLGCGNKNKCPTGHKRQE